MAPEVMEWAKVGAEVVSIVTACAGLLKHVQKSMLKSLRVHFPGRDDFDRLAGRLDMVSDRLDDLTSEQGRRNRNGSRSQSRNISSS